MWMPRWLMTAPEVSARPVRTPRKFSTSFGPAVVARPDVLSVTVMWPSSSADQIAVFVHDRGGRLALTDRFDHRDRAWGELDECLAGRAERHARIRSRAAMPDDDQAGLLGRCHQGTQRRVTTDRPLHAQMRVRGRDRG